MIQIMRRRVIWVFNQTRMIPIKDRASAGRDLAEQLQHYAGRDDVIVLALPRGGVPVAFEIAQALNAPLDLMLVRKLGTPGQEELAMGAIAMGGVRVMNDDIVNALHISDAAIEEEAAKEQQELEHRLQTYRGDRPLLQLKNKCILLVDDGIATGATVRVAIQALRQQQPSRIVVATPVAPPDTVELLRGEADDVICLATPEPFMAISMWYQHFPQTSDGEVKALLQRAWQAADTSPA